MPSSSLLWSVGSLAVSSFVSPTLATAASTSGSYHLLEAWQGKNFLDYFEFFDGADPTNGFVTYTNQSYAESSGLIDITESGSLYMGVDYHTTLSPNGPGRESVRIESKRFYDEGLYIIDIKHMPGSICGTWPAFWSVGPSWPDDGEIDIIEGVNKQESNEIVLHTSGTCDVSGSNEMTGTLTSGECGESSGTIGCVVKGTKGSAGDSFNQQGGGVYAMEWTAKFIKIWYFPRASIPASIESGKPDTSDFGTPMAHLQGTCNFHERFKSQKFILDTTFCGDWAGGVFGDSGCPLSDSSNPIQSCVNYVAQNPAAFKEAYWEINSIKLYELGAESTTSASTTQGGVATSTPESISSTTTAAQSTHTTTSHTNAPAVHTTNVPVASNSPDADATKASDSTKGSKPTDVPAGDDSSQNGQDNDDEPVSRSTHYVTETTTICPLTKGGSIATTFPAPAGASTTTTAKGTSPTTNNVVDTDTNRHGSNGNTVTATVPTAPAASASVSKPSAAPAPPSAGGSAADSESVYVKPQPSVPSSAAAVGNARPSTPVFGNGKPSSSGFVPAPTSVAGVGHGPSGSVPSATTPSSPMFTGAASIIRVGVTGVVCAMAMAFLA
ncbi:concanavalin A-like lectin/glucanase domain-containing protein [Aspergillus ambiguus]|uniref:putative GPI anchored endo-1,3(4)-beta-glucanase n=1 Tax=Aspergillus ambiguus TaxID=176160 RepID=UPI003CCCC6D7